MPESPLETAHDLLVSLAGDGPHTEDPADPSTVQAMQIVLHIPRADPPRRTDVLDAAARAVVKLCLDPRVATDPEFRQGLSAWYGHLIRKVVRRARNSAWEKVQALPGVTVEDSGAQVRAFLPGPVSQVPAEIGKLQISGTELPRDEPRAIDDAWPVIYIDAGLDMTLGKAAAQVGHASMLLAAARPLAWVQWWARGDFMLHVREVATPEFRALAASADAVVVRDAGYTEVAPDSVTVVAIA
ncbi:aminoacyl-tRNA hydrolase [Corynebacterium pacaense]|uniref:aminoacyl-tRNA hydrolase n=1 Tax=Corynebacterium pacaense TaxID=1816684 RepID=UPI0009BC0DAC|nr:peptidyl-tRNA hydrolase [Corynebacterium pacaense]